MKEKLEPSGIKKAILILCATFAISATVAQTVAKNHIYLSQELNLGNFAGLNLGVNYDFNERQTVKAAYDINYRAPESRPDDFSQGLVKAIIQGKEIPVDRLESFQLSIGNIYNLRTDGSIRLKLSFGVGYSIFREPADWQFSEDHSAAQGNYTWDYNKRNMTVLIINPKLEFPMTPNYGFTFSPVLQINKELGYYGFSFGQILGIID